MAERPPSGLSSGAVPWGWAAGVAAAFLVAAGFVYRGALDGAFVSDDLGVIAWNPWIQQLSLENFLQILAPSGAPALSTANYAPVHLLAHALEWRVFGADTTGYHVVNVVLHAGVSLVFAAFLISRGLPVIASVAAGALFLLHPANVEAVAWMFQLKTILALGLSIGALAWMPRRPGWATLLFALALLSKAQALYALPVAAILVWTAQTDDPWHIRARWVVGWLLVAALYAYPQFFAFERLGAAGGVAGESLMGRMAWISALGARTLVLGLTGLGTSVFHEPPRMGWSDPWAWAGLALGLLLAGRIVQTLVARRPEAVWWIWAAAAWLPVSQIFPFLYPMADRYLYLILPGLLGGLLCVGSQAYARFGADRARGSSPALALVAVAVAAGFAVASHARAPVFRSMVHMMRDAEAHYPDGIQAHQLRAREAAMRGDVVATERELRGALAGGWDHFPDIAAEPILAQFRGEAWMIVLERDVVTRWLETNLAMPRPTEAGLLMRGQALVLLDREPEALVAFEAGLEQNGPLRETLLQEVVPVRARLRFRARQAEADRP